jgi:HPt (histidine-containing phosphotransfer) domain-containing protein
MAASEHTREASRPPAQEPGEPDHDREAFLGRLGGLVDLAPELVAIFLEDLPGQIRALEDAAAASDGPRARRVAHRIKGSAAGVGAVRLSRTAARAEAAAASGDDQAVARLAASVAEAFTSARAALVEAWPPEAAPGEPSEDPWSR